MCVIGGHGVCLREVRVQLDLVDGWYDLGALEQAVELFGHEVADADCADFAVAEERLERFVGVDGQVEA